MRLLFLDFDGVLHPLDKTNHPQGWFRWLPILSRLLETAPDVRVVIHSSWRYQCTDGELRQLLGELGARFAGSAPRMPREQAIEMVLQANKDAVAHHLVLDDDPQEFTTGRLNLVLCDHLLGISGASVQARIRDWLSTTAPHS